MDPDVARATIIEKANLVLHSRSDIEHIDAAVELAERVHDLDTWLRAGGFLPTVWAKRPDAQAGRHQEV
jgi:hypothetical protein